VVVATEQSVRSLEESQRILQQRVEVGKAAEVNLFRINTRLANVRQELIKVQNALEVAHSLLNTLIGLPDITQRMKLAGELEYQAVSPDFQQSLESALQRNPRYQALKKEEEMQTFRVRIARAELYPQVRLKTTYLGATGAKDFFPIIDDATVGVMLSFPLFDFNAIRAKVRREGLKLRQFQQKLADMRLKVSLEVQTAILNITEASQQIQTAQVALKEAAESLRIEQIRVDVGKGIINDLLDAQADQLRAEVNHIQALSDYYIAQEALKKAIGAIEVE